MPQPDPTRFETDDEFDMSDSVGTEREMLRKNRRDMFAMLFDPDSVPKAPTGVEEPQSEAGGTEPVDMVLDFDDVEADSLRVEDDLALIDEELDVGLGSIGPEEDL
jgi:hypothetical protein